MCAFVFSTTRATSLTHHIPLSKHPNITRPATQIIRQLFPVSCHVPPQSQYLPQHTALEQPQSVFSPYGKTPSFTPIQKTDKHTVPFILMFMSLDNKREDS